MASKLALGTRKGLLIWQEQNGSWSLANESHMGAHVSYTVRDGRSGWLYSCLAHGHWGNKLHYSADEGRTWEELAAPQYPEGAKLKDDRPAVLRYMWCLTTGPADQSGRIYIGTEPGGLFVSDDQGRTFRLVQSLWDQPSRLEVWMGGGLDEPGIHSVLVDPRDSRRVLIGLSVAGVFASDDDGRSWQARNHGLRADFLPNPDAEIGHDPHLLVQCRGQPDVLWQQNHCGIFRSTDCGRNWSDVSDEEGPAGFGFAIAVDPEDGDVAWVIPAESDEVRVAVDRQMCVCRTNDGGQSWQTYRAGLPQDDCFDFVFRHGLDQSKDRLAFGTACGSLYLSDDRGESWQCLAAHLPPIYSVRFI